MILLKSFVFSELMSLTTETYFALYYIACISRVHHAHYHLTCLFAILFGSLYDTVTGNPIPNMYLYSNKGRLILFVILTGAALKFLNEFTT